MKIRRNKELTNASWLIGGKIAQMIISFVVGIWTARYLGPNNYGLINYATAYIAFFTAICTLGINSIIVKEFIDFPSQQGETIGTAILLRVIASSVSIVIIMSMVGIIDKGESMTLQVTVLASLALIFQSFDTINYWFQAQYKAKIISIITFIAYIIFSLYKGILLVLEKDIRWFAFANSIDYIVIAILLYVVYKNNNGQKMYFSFIKAKELLGKSYHYILSGMMVAIYGQTDKLMLKQLLDESEVAYYSIATAVCAMWVFVLQAIIDSMYPTILNLYSKDRREFEKKNKQLYAIVFYLSCMVSIVICLFGKIVIKIFYGKAYLPAINPLKIVTWYTAFSYLGVARNAWIVCENKQKYLKYIYMGAALINIFLNWILIPLLGASGAALASLITQIFTSLILPFCFKELRYNSYLMLEGIMLRGVFKGNK